MKRNAIITTAALAILCSITVFAQTPEFDIVKPITTGVPGQEVRVMKFDPAAIYGSTVGLFFLIAIANYDRDAYPYTGGVSTFDGTTWTDYTPNNSPLTHWQVVAVELDTNGILLATPMSPGVVQILIGNTPTPTPTPTATPTATVTPTTKA